MCIVWTTIYGAFHWSKQDLLIDLHGTQELSKKTSIQRIRSVQNPIEMFKFRRWLDFSPPYFGDTSRHPVMISPDGMKSKMVCQFRALCQASQERSALSKSVLFEITGMNFTCWNSFPTTLPLVDYLMEPEIMHVSTKREALPNTSN